MKTKYRTFLEKVTKTHGYKPKHIEVAEVLVENEIYSDVKKTANMLANRYLNNSFLKSEEEDVLREHFFLQNSNQTVQHYEIPYWEGAKDCVQDLFSPLLLHSIAVDRVLIERIWLKKPENLRLIALPDNKMDGGCLKYRQGDIVCIDVSENNQAKEGIYFYTYKSKNAKSKKLLASVAKMRVNFEGNTEIVVENPLDITKRTKIVTAEMMAQSSFKIIGRVIFNFSQTT